MSNFTYEDFYNPIVSTISKIIMDIVFVLQVSMTPFVIYAILKNSSMGTYRLYLIHEIFWSTLLSFSFAIISPAVTGVYLIIVINSWVEDWFDINIWYTLMDIFLFFLIATTVSLYVSALYR
jgi:hypothetical protein